MLDSWTCPDHQTLFRYITGRLSDSGALSVRDHLAHCEGCRTTIGGMETAAADATVSRKPTGSPTRFEETVWLNEGGDADVFRLSMLHPSKEVDSLGQIGSYEVLDLLGQGAMGIVYKAFDATLHRIVAIKVMEPRLATSERARRRFLREARAAAAINHPNVVTIHAVGEQEGVPYLVMEYICGQSLRERLRAEKTLRPAAILRIGLQITEGLAAAHEHGVIHRDIKPANIMLENSVERAKITDFGLARAAMDQTDMTSVDQIVGTPAYMSPEQIRGDAIDTRSDLFSLGCVLYTMASGLSPFRGSHTLEVLRKVNDFEPPPLHEVNPEIPEGLSRLIHGLLAKEPNDRPASAADVAAAWKHHLVSANLSPSERSIEHTLPRRPRQRATKKAIWVGMAVLLLILAGMVYLHKYRNTGHFVAASPRLPDVITVSQNGSADVRSLNEALKQARPGSVIRLLDDATYEGPFLIDNPRLWQNITIDSTKGATLVATGRGNAILTLRETPGVVIRGVRFRPKADQFAVTITGKSDGVRLEEVITDKAETHSWAQIYISGQATGSASHPIQVIDSRVRGGEMGVVVEGQSGEPVAHIQIVGNRFDGPGTHVMLLQYLQDIQVRNNIFQDGCGVLLNLPSSNESEGIRVTNNTFFETSEWISPAESQPGTDSVEIGNNLILASPSLDTSDQALAQMARSWHVHHNVWESERQSARNIPRPVVAVDQPAFAKSR